MLSFSDHIRAFASLENYRAFLKDDLSINPVPYSLRCKNGLNFQLRSRRHARISDIDIFTEVILKDEYNLRHSLKSDANIVDIGAHIGFFSCYAAHCAPSGKIFSAEPHPDNYRMLFDNIRLNKVQNIKALNVAVSDTSTSIEISQEEWNTGAHSMYGSGKEKVTVPAITLDMLLSEAPLKIDLMKIDCEGAEFPILLNSSPEVLKKVRKIIFEQHMTDNTLKLFKKDSILSRLNALGFQTSILKTMHYPGEGEFWLVQAEL